MLVLSGGVSVGKYDLVEQALRELGAEFFFDAVALRPGKPAVFGWCQEKPVFGLPGNPVSTMVTFELFAVPWIEMLSGYKPQALPFFQAKAGPCLERKTGRGALPSGARELAERRASRGSDAVGRVGRYRRGGARKLLREGRSAAGCKSKPANGWMCCRAAESSSAANHERTVALRQEGPRAHGGRHWQALPRRAPPWRTPSCA